MRKALVALAPLCLVSSCPAESKSNHPPDWKALIAAAHDNGYREGYLAGHDAAGGAERLGQCNAALSFATRREADAKRYEACLVELSGAVGAPEFYLRQIAAKCVAEAR